MTTYFATAIRAATKDETWVLDTGTSLSTKGTAIDATGMTTGQSFIIKGSLTSTSGTAFVLGNSALTDSATSIRIDYVASFTGNGLDNTIIGNSGVNVLSGGRGDDALTGNGGADTFVFASLSGEDTITDFQNGKDHIDLTGYSGIDDFGDISSIGTVQGDTVITLSGGDTITLEDIKAATITADDFLF